MNSTMLAVIITLGIFVIAGLLSTLASRGAFVPVMYYNG